MASNQPRTKRDAGGQKPGKDEKGKAPAKAPAAPARPPPKVSAHDS